MGVTQHDRLRIASQQLETALALYFQGTDHYSVITLAGVADEIFGQMLRAQGQVARLEEIKNSVAAIYRKLWKEEIEPKIVVNLANHAKNALKHWDTTQPIIVEFDLLEEAKDMVERAIANYWALYNDLTPAMERFEREVLNPA